MAKPKIAFFLPGLGIYNRGAEVFVTELSKKLKNKYDITFLCGGSIPGDWICVKGISRDNKVINFFISIPIAKTILKLFLLDPVNVEWITASLKALPKLYRANFDLIIPEAGVWGNLICRVIRFLKGAPFVDIGHSRFGYWELLCALQYPDAYVSFTRYNEGRLKKFVKGIKSILIPIGVDLDKFNPSVSEVSLPLPRPIYLCVGALEPVKRIHLAIEAIARLEEGSLVVIGDGQLKKEILALGERLLGNRFLLTTVPHSEMVRYYVGCDVFTLPSAHEAFGIVYLEAMACNKPVVSTRDEIRMEIIQDSGILCNCSNTEEYSMALKKAVHEDFEMRPRKQAEKFGWDDVALKYDELFKSLIK